VFDRRKIGVGNLISKQLAVVTGIKAAVAAAKGETRSVSRYVNIAMGTLIGFS
jgi:hypothetical protein